MDKEKKFNNIHQLEEEFDKLRWYQFFKREENLIERRRLLEELKGE